PQIVQIRSEAAGRQRRRAGRGIAEELADEEIGLGLGRRAQLLEHALALLLDVRRYRAARRLGDDDAQVLVELLQQTEQVVHGTGLAVGGAHQRGQRPEPLLDRVARQRVGERAGRALRRAEPLPQPLLGLLHRARDRARRARIAALLVERGLPCERLQQQEQRRVLRTRKHAEEPRGLVRGRKRRERDVEQQRRVQLGELVEVELAHPSEQAAALRVVDLGLRTEDPRLGRELRRQRLAAVDEHLPVALAREE